MTQRARPVLRVAATGRPLLSGFCAASLRHDLCLLTGCACTCHDRCAACGQPLPTDTKETRP